MYTLVHSLASPTSSFMPDIRLLLSLLAMIALFAAIGRRFGIPDPIMFAIGGVALALIPGIPAVALPPSLVLVVFLPPLIFAAAQDTTTLCEPSAGLRRYRALCTHRSVQSLGTAPVGRLKGRASQAALSCG